MRGLCNRLMSGKKANHDTEQRLIIAGFGGQGLLTAGKLLCKSCLAEGNNVTFLPSYGSEVRGGTANCHVVVASAEIASPSVDRADAMIILNELSLARFGDNIKDDGLLLLNSSLIATDATALKTGNVFRAPATELAAELGNVIVANIIMLGALVTLKRICRIETLEASIRDWLRDKGRSANAELNLNALHCGAGLARDDMEQPHSS